MENPLTLSEKSLEECSVAQALAERAFDYHRVGIGRRPMTFLPNGKIGEGAELCEMFWNIGSDDEGIYLDLSSEKTLTVRLRKLKNGSWEGWWVDHEKGQVQLTPVSESENEKLNAESIGQKEIPSTFESGKGSEAERVAAEKLLSNDYDYHRLDHGRRRMTFETDGSIAIGAEALEEIWDVRTIEERICLLISSESEVTMKLFEDEDGIWRGNWLRFEKSAVELRPLKRKSSWNYAPPPTLRCEPPLELVRGGDSATRIAICLPSRGLVYSRTIESIMREALNLQPRHHIALFFTHGEPLPDCYTGLIERALEWGCDATWLVEEDNYMPEGVLSALLECDSAIVACDYYNHAGSGPVVEPKIGAVEFFAFGCTLVYREVWEIIGFPYCFRGHGILQANGTYVLGKDGVPVEAAEWYEYGGQDIDFSFRVHRLGLKAQRLPGSQWRAGHFLVTEYGHRKANDGSHKIVMH